MHMAREEAALYQAPYAFVEARVKPERVASRIGAGTWWIHWRPRPEMRERLDGLTRYIATPRVSKHRIFVWLPAETLLDSAAVAIARDDDYTFGVLHSRVHEGWALRMGTQLETRPRYTPTTTFETFPFPRPTEVQREAIGAAARRLDELRRGWLDPVDASEEDLRRRTLTNLYNEMPAWLRDVHGRLDEAVLTAYGWPADITDDDLLARLLGLNLERAGSGRLQDPDTRDEAP